MMFGRLAKVSGWLLFVFSIFSPIFIGIPISLMLFILSIILISHQEIVPHIQKERLQWLGTILQEIAKLGAAFVLGIMIINSSWGAEVTNMTLNTPIPIFLVGICAVLGSYLAKTKRKKKLLMNNK